MRTLRKSDSNRAVLFNLCHFARLCCAVLVLALSVQAAWDTPHDPPLASVAVAELTFVDDAGASDASETAAGHEHEAASDHAVLAPETVTLMVRARAGAALAAQRFGEPQDRPLDSIRRPPRSA